jgi:two-component system LytT family response regulator
MKTSYNALIVDDEFHSREILKDLIQKYCPELQIIGSVESAKEALATIKEKSPDVVFLDIEMPGGTGFDLLDQLGEFTFDIIFVTAYHEHAVQAFRLSAIDYLLKPLNFVELKEAVQKLGRSKALKNQDKIEALKSIYFNASALDKIVLPTSNGYVFIKMDEIIYVEAHSNYSEFHILNKRPIIVSRTMGQFESILSSFFFYRIHHKYIVNLKLIEHFDTKENHLKMSNGMKLLISSRRKSDFIKCFRPY